MKIIFAGTASFAVPSLKNLIGQSQHRIIEVITQPDRPQGRGLRETQSPVKKLALEHQSFGKASVDSAEPLRTARLAEPLKIAQPESINQSEVVQKISEVRPDIMVVAAYGQKIGAALRAIPRYGCVNIHASLLPRYRGAAPVAYAILNGEKETGVTIFKIVEEMDAGPIMAQDSLMIKEKETAGNLTGRLAQLGADLLLKTLVTIETGRFNLTEQDQSQVTYAPKLKKTDGQIDWHKTAPAINNLIRAMQPWPGGYTFWESEKRGLVKINILD
ncbi:MAG: methionyl-tRNA formyltransferase, partial [Planctomycetota bacterium]